MSKLGQILVVSLALVGLSALPSEADAGKFTLQIYKSNGMSWSGTNLEWKIFNASDQQICSGSTSTGGFVQTCDSALSDKRVYITISRSGGTPIKIDNLHGGAGINHTIHVILP
jgi:hypothetical protein